MDTRQLKTLVAIATHGTFARAADIVGLTPSAVSQQVLALEQELDATLFDRTSRPPKMTPQGLQVLELAKDILRMEDDTKASLRGDRIAGTLMLGSVRSSALNLLPKAIVQMRAQYPELKTNLRVSLSTTLIADVAAGRLDAAVVAEHVGFPHALRWSPFLREPLWLIAPKGTELSDPIQLLKTRPFVRFGSAVPLANLIDTEISRLGVVTQDIAEIDTIGTIVTCVRQGLGISVVPHVALHEPDDRELMRLPFGRPQVTRQIGIVERTVSPRSEIIARIHEVLARLCGEHGVSRP
jgi:DNA-binding transcriptional LysR family regulator